MIGCDFHTRYQQIAMMDQTTAELVDQRLRALPYLENRILTSVLRIRPKRFGARAEILLSPPMASHHLPRREHVKDATDRIEGGSGILTQ